MARPSKTTIDKFTLKEIRRLTDTNMLCAMSDAQCWEFYNDLKELYATGSNNIFRRVSRKVRITWGLCASNTELTVENAVRRVAKKMFGEPSEHTPLKLSDKKQKQIVEEIKIARTEIREKFHPLLESIKLVNTLWGEYEFWGVRARETGIESPYVAKILNAIRENNHEITELFKDLRLIDCDSKKLNPEIKKYAENMQVVIQQLVLGSESMGDFLGDLTGQLEALPPEMLEGSQEIDVGVNPTIDTGTDTGIDTGTETNQNVIEDISPFESQSSTAMDID